MNISLMDAERMMSAEELVDAIVKAVLDAKRVHGGADPLFNMLVVSAIGCAIDRLGLQHSAEVMVLADALADNARKPWRQGGRL